MPITQITEMIVYTSSLIIKELKKIIQETFTFVNAFINARFAKDKLILIEDEVDLKLLHIDKYLYSSEDHIQASALFGIRLINTGVRNENDPAFALLSENKEFYIKSINNERIEKNYSKKQDHKKDDQK
ncbi:26S proteasome non-ATPase regulatory subunit 2 [Rhizophagus irregularis DAOM 181602=DAOM 197198]|uniref:Uncharacterized protein n=1 Tax=Rhizophagus irregularis (strain DAOM 181602 / DAOM 197198 / MUCL 43194) TaxID=747089 RepID=A0A2P4PE83_RHIID|nr:hypothetical protein GLOIN_2v1783754 [Rhizophagus irregularis DAOM 181602=DAOM 197198]POG63703.1 hypothetical protein GLOIN_2v1783754 [Rhizophagus irregularis DAOM 181602=DAOM 197198]GBC16098.2 26S proteasome non-ATPase regulatory subunit 2 [Rhizophagus irregularis DAOM 181602=DAOM 197198]|eukprot:XP_025170569.1 hypothetical protein GLOIN_2v1783754 [Rhizophagus irregularis DAOM 181602=DAOM 197198]